MKRLYETCVVLDGTLPEETISKERKAVETLLTENATFDKTEEWGKRSLAYEINKKKQGVYFLFIFEGDNETPKLLDKHFKLNTSVLRYLTVLRDPDKPIKPRPRPEAPEGSDGDNGDDSTREEA